MEGILKKSYLHISHAAVLRAQLAHEQLNREREFGVIKGLRPLDSDLIHGSHQERPWRDGDKTDRTVKVRAQSVPGAKPHSTTQIETSKKVRRLSLRRRDRRMKQQMQEFYLRELPDTGDEE